MLKAQKKTDHSNNLDLILKNMLPNKLRRVEIGEVVIILRCSFLISILLSAVVELRVVWLCGVWIVVENIAVGLINFK